MMHGWKKQGDGYNQQGPRTRPNHRKPPLGSWQPSVPSWEKRFCTSVGSVPWRKIVEAKRCMHLYDGVVKWNDSAGEEAFYNAKSRFYAHIHGLPCDISLPDPDMYIDEINWDSEIDHNLILDLECESMVSDACAKDQGVVIFGDALFSYQGFSTMGWGDAEEDIKKPAKSSSENKDCAWDNNHVQQNNHVQHDGAVEQNGWGVVDNNNNNLSTWNVNYGVNGDSGWGVIDNGVVEGNGWGVIDNNYNNNSPTWNVNYGVNVDSGWADCWNNPRGMGDNWNNSHGWGDVNIGDSWNNSHGWRDVNTGDSWNNSYGWGDVNKGRAEWSGRNMSRYKTSRFRGDDNQRNNNSWRSGSGKKRINNFVSGQVVADERPPSRPWKSRNSCAPVIHHASAEAGGDHWSWEKPVS